MGHRKVIIEIANARPRTASELGAIRGVGKAFMEKYGAAVLKIVNDHG
jgi:superfamily II DNA helicase RecQ